MPLAKQIDAVFNSRWCGAYWQEMGLSVIPSVSWGDYNSFEFAFVGIEAGSTVALSTIGNRKCINEFMRGYNEMIKQINPNVILCYGEPFKEMEGNIYFINYLETTGRAN